MEKLQDTLFLMTTQILPLYRKKPEDRIKHTLDNTIKSTNLLATKLYQKGYEFQKNHHIDTYNFDFYCPKLKIAIEIDGYTHEFEDIYNLDATKKLYISFLDITVLRFSDYQILVDIDQVLRTIKNQVFIASLSSYVV
ncbi:DUF559 domain-containing protein [Aquimarina sp. U1-2]|uniref:endonuclease domain-containing protein n=1 Tax=Aquimarina sp. U1-2 TaxID=2823141 RepID=UPI001AECE66E|nr:DUF559 domain-containing protein [Aquimarina sp. U1-2]MBP2832445.1 DUF559 domain-containing protein [Aquimarina sp. U1-2]